MEKEGCFKLLCGLWLIDKELSKNSFVDRRQLYVKRIALDLLKGKSLFIVCRECSKDDDYHNFSSFNILQEKESCSSTLSQYNIHIMITSH